MAYSISMKLAISFLCLGLLVGSQGFKIPNANCGDGKKCYAKYACFPALATVQTPLGSRRMQDLQVGDLVLSVTKSGSVEFKPVYFMAHREKVNLNAYVQLEMIDAKSEVSTIRLTHPHFIAVGEDPTGHCALAAHGKKNLAWDNSTEVSWESHRIVRGGSVRMGQVLWRMQEGKLTPACVVNKKDVVDLGGFTPFVKAEGIVVDGIVASPHLRWPKLLLPISYLPQWMLPHIYDTLLLPIYAMYNVLGSKFMWALNDTAFFGTWDLFFPVIGNALIAGFIGAAAFSGITLFRTFASPSKLKAE